MVTGLHVPAARCGVKLSDSCRCVEPRDLASHMTALFAVLWSIRYCWMLAVAEQVSCDVHSAWTSVNCRSPLVVLIETIGSG